MRIEELEANQAIKLLVNAGGQQLEFPSTVLEAFPRKHLILAAPIMKNDKIVIAIILLHPKNNPKAPISLTSPRPIPSFLYAINANNAISKNKKKAYHLVCLQTLEKLVLPQEYSHKHIAYSFSICRKL